MTTSLFTLSLACMCSDTYFEKVISFEAGPEWMRDFAATTRSHLHSMNATQLQQLMQAVRCLHKTEIMGMQTCSCACNRCRACSAALL